MDKRITGYLIRFGKDIEQNHKGNYFTENSQVDMMSVGTLIRYMSTDSDKVMIVGTYESCEVDSIGIKITIKLLDKFQYYQWFGDIPINKKVSLVARDNLINLIEIGFIEMNYQGFLFENYEDGEVKRAVFISALLSIKDIEAIPQPIV